MSGPAVSVVTGAGSGLGRAAAALLARRGDVVLCLDRDGPAVHRTAERLPGAVAAQVDVTDETAVDDAVQGAVDRWGRIDHLVHAAGIEEDPTPADEMTPATFQHVVRVNLLGSFVVARAVSRPMMACGGGAVVLFGSILSVVGYGGNAAYTASKGGVLQLGRALAVDWAPHGIRVNVIGPGPVETPMSQATLDDPVRGPRLRHRIPFGRPASPGEVAEVVAFLTSPASAYMTGAFVPVDGGYLAR